MQSDPQLWFISVELEFENNIITSDDSRFRWVAVRPPPDVTHQVRNVTVSSRWNRRLYLGLPQRKFNASDNCFKVLSLEIKAHGTIAGNAASLRPSFQRRPDAKKAVTSTAATKSTSRAYCFPQIFTGGDCLSC